jgi:hypothetical protein
MLMGERILGFTRKFEGVSSWIGSTRHFGLCLANQLAITKEHLKLPNFLMVAGFSEHLGKEDHDPKQTQNLCAKIPLTHHCPFYIFDPLLKRLLNP